MPARFSKDKNASERGATLILFTVMMAIVVLPIIGLSIDGAIVYLAQSRLSSACDAAALAGARALNVGQDFAAQKSYAENIAGQYFQANFPNGLLGSINVISSPVASESSDHIRKVNVTATADINLYFLRLLGRDIASINASAATTRRDVNVVLTLDRSGSMAGVCSVLKSDGQDFVSRFTNGRDTVGLITFMGSASIDFGSSKQFKPQVSDTLGQLNCGGNTGSAEALYQAHKQILSVAEPGALNVIVFFTDGVPNGYSAAFPLKNGFTCNNSSTVPGFMADGGGIYSDTAQSISSTSNIDVPNCSYKGSQANLSQYYQFVPETDLYGNSASATGYATVARDANGQITFSSNNSDAVSENAADDAARQARNDGIFIYVIGLGSNGGVDGTLLKRIANDPAATTYTTSQPSGKYYYSPNAGQLGAAFNAIASEILRLSR